MPEENANPASESPAPENAAPENAAPENAAETDAAEAEVPLNRAARRARLRESAPPRHVGPQPDRTRTGRGPRAHTKRRSR